MAHVLGIDIGGSGIKAAPVDVDRGELAADRFRIATPQPATPEAVAEAVGRLIHHFDWRGLVGCAFPARVKYGVATTASNIDPRWIGTNAMELFATTSGCTVSVLNDADAAGVGECRFGAARNQPGLTLVLTVGTGIGSAMFMNGELIPNTELGHVRMNDLPAEDFASDRTRKVEKLGWKVWAQRFQEYLDYLEFLLSPDLIVLGGGISKEKKRSKYFDSLQTEARLVTATLENDAGIIGAAVFAADAGMHRL